LLVGFPPYKKEIDKWKIMGGRIKDKWKWDVIYPPTISDCAQDFISKILKENPDDRASIR
jgi:serine/threonine protein kinase